MSRGTFANNYFTTYTDARNFVTTSDFTFDDNHTFDQHEAECERIGRIFWDLTTNLSDGEEVEADDMWRKVLTQAGYDPCDFGY